MNTTVTLKIEEVNLHIVEWLKNYAINAKVKGFVIGISGGVDSAVTSTLCAQTGFPTLCVEMPIHQAESQVNRGKEHISQLKNRFKNVTSVVSDLTAVYDNFKNSMPKEQDKTQYYLALANTRARLRMTTLYFHAGINNYLVAGTGNKVEDFGVGFYTKYGDGGVDLSPIADLMKSEVFAMAKLLEIPKSIQIAAPTDGLFGDNRTDEQQLGASYDELELAMHQAAAGKTIEDLKDRELEVFRIYNHLNKSNQHKMQAIPVCKIPQRLKT